MRGSPPPVEEYTTGEFARACLPCQRSWRQRVVRELLLKMAAISSGSSSAGPGMTMACWRPRWPDHSGARESKELLNPHSALDPGLHGQIVTLDGGDRIQPHRSARLAASSTARLSVFGNRRVFAHGGETWRSGS